MNRMPAGLEIDITAEAEAEEARRATGASVSAGEPDPRVADPEVAAKVQRRRFSAEYRLRILKQADACKKPGELGALLRREGLYSSLLTNWRRQREQARSSACAHASGGRRRGGSTRASSSSKRRTPGSSASCSRPTRLSPSKKKLPRSWGSP